MDDLLSEFLTETAESLATLDVEIVNLEQNPGDTAILSNVFRLMHTIKGTCGFLGLPRLEKLAHAAEDVMGKYRDGELEVTADSVTLILSSIDRIKEILEHLEVNEVEPDGDDQDLISKLRATADGEAPGAEPEPVADEAPADADGGAEGPVTSDQGFPVAAELLAEFEQATGGGGKSDADAEAEMMAAMEADEAKPEAEAPAPEEAAPAPEPETPKPPAPVKKAAPPAKKPEAKEPAKEGGGVAAQSIRVNVDLLEDLMTLVSEMVLTRNQLLQMVRGKDDSEFHAPLQRLSHITSDLQEGVMKTRMQPIGNAWAKLPRIIRDLATEMDKKIDLQMLGAETELDRQVLELIKDPLTHMVRNSADHGLEGTEERLAAGKPETGRVTLDAFHEGGHIIIRIEDDGRGLNLDKIGQKAVANGQLTEAELAAMSDNQIAQLIFKAGLSTAEKVTSVSGRGVGMDVVRTNIEKIGGTVELKTERGEGSEFLIKIPLTLAIVSALVVQAGGERFAIPQISVVELVRVSQRSDLKIESLNDAPVLRLRERLLPLISLGKLLKLDDPDTGEEVETADVEDGQITSPDAFIVVTQVGTYTFGIIVDQVFDTEEIVVKPVAPILRDISLFSGNTILGDGSVIMILDPNGIAQASGEMAMGGQDAMAEIEHQDSADQDKTSLLLFRAGDANTIKAVPLALVARLEEIEVKNIEYSYGRPVVQYRGNLMPLVAQSDNTKLNEEGRQPLLVFSDRDRSMGLIVDEIVDIVEDRLSIELKSDMPGVIGSAIIKDEATDVLDTAYYLKAAFGDWFSADQKRYVSGRDGNQRVLLVDDSAFFRNLLSPMLSAAGYDVFTVDSADAALKHRKDGNGFDLIITDIEMPDMDGFELAQVIRSEGEWSDVPLIALSSHTGREEIDRAREVGFDDFVPKSDRDALLASIGSLLMLNDDGTGADRGDVVDV